MSIIKNIDLQESIINAYNKTANDTQHETMANTYIQAMSDALKQYDNSAHSDDFYTDLAWGGLQKTDAWKKLPINGIDTANIDNINFREEQGDGQAQGKKCGH